MFFEFAKMWANASKQSILFGFRRNTGLFKPKVITTLCFLGKKEKKEKTRKKKRERKKKHITINISGLLSELMTQFPYKSDSQTVSKSEQISPFTIRTTKKSGWKEGANDLRLVLLLSTSFLRNHSLHLSKPSLYCGVQNQKWLVRFI